MDIKRLKSTDNNFLLELKNFLTFDVDDNEEIIKITNDIVNKVKENGDKALLDFTKKFDRLSSTSVQGLEIQKEELMEAYKNIPQETQKFLEVASE